MVQKLQHLVRNIYTITSRSLRYYTNSNIFHPKYVSYQEFSFSVLSRYRTSFMTWFIKILKKVMYRAIAFVRSTGYMK